MTTRHTARDEQIVDQVLHQADAEDDAELKSVLLELRAFAAGPPVVPSAELAALMATGSVSLDARRRRKLRRTAIAALAVAAFMGIGTAAVAATDPGFRENAQKAVTTVIDAITHGNSGRPAPVPNNGSSEAPAHAPELPAPARDTPGRPGKETSGQETSGQETQRSPNPAEGLSGQGNRPSPNPGTPAATERSGGQGTAPAAPEHQNTANRPSPASPPASPHN